jgi:hypothetical protein
LRILFAAAITALTRAGALRGAIAIPSTSFALAPAGAAHRLESAERPPELPQAAEAPVGTKHSASTAKAAAVLAFNLLLIDVKTDLLCRPTGLAVGLALKEPAPPPRWVSPMYPALLTLGRWLVPPLPASRGDGGIRLTGYSDGGSVHDSLVVC